MIKYYLGISLRVEVLSAEVSWFPIFWETTILIFRVVVKFAFPRAMGMHHIQHKLSLVVLILAILTGVRWSLRVILICISQMAKDIDLFPKCLWAILDSSVENYAYICIQFLIGLLGILMLISCVLYILEISPMGEWLVKIVFLFRMLPFWLIDCILYSTWNCFSISRAPIYFLLLSVSVLLEVYLGNDLLCSSFEGYFPLSLLSGSVWLNLCWGL